MLFLDGNTLRRCWLYPLLHFSGYPPCKTGIQLIQKPQHCFLSWHWMPWLGLLSPCSKGSYVTNSAFGWAQIRPYNSKLCQLFMTVRLGITQVLQPPCRKSTVCSSGQGCARTSYNLCRIVLFASKPSLIGPVTPVCFTLFLCHLLLGRSFLWIS